MIPGGGIGDGAIDGVVNLYVIDDTTRDPVAGAEVRVGEVSGTTDATGLFVAEGVVGPQDIVVKAPGHRKELWLGANGANVTIDLQKDLAATPPSVTLAGGITNYASVQVTQTDHVKVALISYSQTDDLGDPANEIATPNDTNVCVAAANAADPCNFTIVTRTGKVALFATILDVDTKGTPELDDDTSTILAFAVRQNIDTATATGNQDLALIADANTQTVTVDFDSPPSGLDVHGGIVAIELTDGVLPVGTAFTLGSSATMKAPKPSALTGATTYRLIALATDGATAPAQAITVRRALTGSTLSAGTYLAPPGGISLTRSGGSWTNVGGATVHSLELTQGATQILGVTVLDNRTSFDLPDLIVLPSGPITATVNAIGAPGFDVTDFALDDDIDKIDRLGAQETTIN